MDSETPKGPEAANVSVPASAVSAASSASNLKDPETEMLSKRMDQLALELIEFWTSKGVDRDFGGFHGTIDRAGEPKEPTDKGLIQQSRHLWTLSTWYERRAATPEVKALADTSYRFLVDHFLDADGEFFFKVSRDGKKVTEPKKVLYAQSFAIYALATYGRVFGVEAAKAQALACFQSIDKRAHDAKNLGYDQTHDPGWLAEGAQKGTNTHIHLLEAFTELLRATGDAVVRERLEELVTVTRTKLFQPEFHYVHQEFLVDWTPHADRQCSYGHDLETVWLLLDAVDALGRPDDADARAAALSLGLHAAEYGFDAELGGYFEEGPPGGAPAKLSKIWWVQAEALPGLWRLYELTGDRQQLERLTATLSYIEQHQRDAEYGEWYWETNPDGSVGPRGTDKGEEWKTSYHGVRALVFTSDWMRGVD